MEYIRVSAKKVEDAVIEASIQLETTSDNIEYEVLEHGSSGFFGIGSKPAVIRARRKEEKKEFDEMAEIKQMFETKPSVKMEEPRAPKEEKKETVEKRETAVLEKEIKEENLPKTEQKPEKQPEKMPKKVKKDKPVKEKIQKEKQPTAEPKKEEPKKKEIKEADKERAEKKAVEFLKQVFDAMQMQVQITAEFKEDALEIGMEGEDMGVLIGKRGQTLDSLQYLVSLVVNKEKEAYIRVKLDTENYRSRRKETLENLAKNIAFKVKRTKKPVFLEPMNPYERRVIHSALQNDPYVTTHSEGEEPYRKVVVTLKK
ncbi:MAG: KH domain-containing protein [Clostridiales bacterium]|nr:KH domain-containing protein [Clostridiales bacterium]